jgi:hypothetical protein
MTLRTGVVRKVLEALIASFRAWFRDVTWGRSGLYCGWYPEGHNASRLSESQEHEVALLLAVVQDDHTVGDERPCHGILDEALVCGVVRLWNLGLS